MNCFKVLPVLLLLAAPAEAALLKFATLAPEGSTWMNILREFDKELREKTRGRLGLKIYPGGVSGDEKDVVKKIRFGQLHGAGFTGVGLGEILPEMRVLELPLLFRDHEELDRVRGELTPHFKAAFEKKGFIHVAWADVGFVRLYSKNPIVDFASLQASKMWMWQGDPVAEAYFKALALSPVPLSLPDVMMSLQTGLVDTVYASPLAAVALQWFTKTKYYSKEYFVYSSGAVLVQKGFYAEIAAPDRKIFHDLADKYFDRLNRETRVENGKATEAMEKRGIEPVAWTAESKAPFVEAAKSVRASLTGQLYPKELLERVEAILKQGKKAAKK